MFRTIRKPAWAAAAAAVAAAGAGAVALSVPAQAQEELHKKHKFTVPPVAAEPPSRAAQLEKMKTEEFDLVVVGGGATGSGIALDAVTRGLKVALVERDDFSCGTSSRSTKLIHGGVRYLEKAVWNLDYNQYELVKEALHERKVFLDIAPHLTFALPIMIPVYTWWQLPYFWMGVKAYDLLAGRQNLESSYMLSRSRALDAFPMLSDDKLKGAIVYYDGSQNDSRMNVSLIMTAVERGATILNHCEVTELTKGADGQLNGVVAKDTDGNAGSFNIKAKSVVNATGPFTDSLRKMDDKDTKEICAPSSGVHIILPGYYSPKKMGLLDPATSDGRVIFFLPWQGNTLAGTTDQPTKITANPIPSEEDIDFILNEVRHYVEGKVDVRREDVLAAWSGIRPLVRDPHAKNTESLVRNHLITYSESGLVTIAGGKWTTYRQMAEETVDACIAKFGLKPEISAKAVTRDVKLIGANNWSPLTYIDLIQQENLDPEVAKHLSENYGSRAFTVASLAEMPTPEPGVIPQSTLTKGKRILYPYPYLDAECKYSMKYEYATTAIDFLARRTRLAFLNAAAAYEALPEVIEIMAKELKWDEARKESEFNTGVEYLYSMGLSPKNK